MILVAANLCTPYRPIFDTGWGDAAAARCGLCASGWDSDPLYLSYSLSGRTSLYTPNYRSGHGDFRAQAIECTPLSTAWGNEPLAFVGWLTGRIIS